MNDDENVKFNNVEDSSNLSQPEDVNVEVAQNNEQASQPSQQQEVKPKKLGFFSKLKKYKPEKKTLTADEERENRGIPKKAVENKTEEKSKKKKGKLKIFLIIAFILIAVTIAIVIVISLGSGSKGPKSITFSEGGIYTTTGEDITLSASLDGSYKGKNKNIHLSVSSGVGIIDLSKYEIKSGEDFTIHVTTHGGVPVGGMARIWATADEDATVVAYLDVMIDRPVVKLNFDNEAEDNIYLLDSFAANASAYYDEAGTEQVSLIGDSIGRDVNYMFCYCIEDFEKFIEYYYDGDSEKFDKEDRRQIDYEGDMYTCVKLTDKFADVAEVNNNKLTPKIEGTFFVEASINRWASRNAEVQIPLKVVKKIESKRIDFTSLTVNSAEKSGRTILRNQEYNYAFKTLLNIEINGELFTEAQQAESQQYIEVSCESSNVSINDLTKDGFTLAVGNILANENNVVITVKYKNSDGYLEDTFTINLKAS